MVKIASLSSNSDFKKLLKLKKINNNYFIIYFGKIYPKINNNLLKISFIAKKKIGNAVQRNKIKRKLKSAVLKNRDKIFKNYAYLLIAKQNIFKEKFNVINKEIGKTFEKIRN